MWQFNCCHQNIKPEKLAYFSALMLKTTFKYICCTAFILILTVKMMIPVTAVFIGHFHKNLKPTVLLTDQENDDEKSSDFAKDLLIKAKKGTDEALIHLYEFVPFVTAVNLLYHQQDALFKQTHFPPILTPPPDKV